jgi:hypothetical protein
MLQGMSSEVRECLAKAAEARRKGDETSDKEIKVFWREMEERWTRLARSYEQVGTTDDFLKNAAGSDGGREKSGPHGSTPYAPAASGASFLPKEGT